MEIYPNFNIEKMNSEDKQLTLDKRYIRMALIWAENSYCKRRKVGALIVKEKMIISDGYNGTPAGYYRLNDGIDFLKKAGIEVDFVEVK